MWFGICWLIGLLVVAVLAGRALFTAVAADGWQQGTARVVRSELVKKKRKRSTYEVAVVEFAYDAGGVKQTGTMLSAFDNWSRDGSPREVVARFPLGADVPVAVNPDDPTEAYVQTGFRWAYGSTVMAFLPALAMLGAALAGGLRQLPPGAKVVGSYFAFSQPLPRLVLLQTSAIQMGMIWALIASGVGVAGLFLTESLTPEWGGRTMIPPGINPGAGDMPVLLLVVPAVTAAAAVVGWLWRSKQEASHDKEMVIDAGHDLMVFAKPAFGARPTLALSAVQGLQTRKVVTRTSKSKTTKYEVWVVTAEGPSKLIVKCSTSLEADEIVGWISETMVAGGFAAPEQSFVDND